SASRTSRTPSYLAELGGALPPIPSAGPCPEKKRDLLLRRLERTDQIARFELGRGQDHLPARLAELIDVLVDDSTELGHQRAGFLPLAVIGKYDRADDGLDLVGMEIFGDALLVQRLRRVDGLLHDLTRSVAVRREIVAERIDLGGYRLPGVFVEELLGAVEIHALFRQPCVVVDDAVEQGAQIRHHGCELQTDHAAAENL